MTVIDDFRGDYRWLSNFHACPVMYDGVLYPSSEHAYQAAKTLDARSREVIRNAPRPRDARNLGQTVVLRPGWDEMRVEVMRVILLDKFTRSPALGAQLLCTGDTRLVEGNTWGDRFFGVCGGTGENWLGRLLMETRARLGGES